MPMNISHFNTQAKLTYDERLTIPPDSLANVGVMDK